MELFYKSRMANPLAPLPVHLLCPACKQPLRNAFQTPQGFRLCEACVNKLHPTRRTVCPGTTDADNDDNTDGDGQRLVCRSQCVVDLGIRNELSRVKVSCPNYSRSGCNEQMYWKQIDRHLTEDCKFEMMECRHCSASISVYAIKRSHLNLQSETCCSNYRSHCPHCGQWGLTRDQMNRSDYLQHAAECLEIPIQCPLADFGCREMLNRAILDDHLKNRSSEHLLMLASTVKKQQVEINNAAMRSRCDGDRISKLEKENKLLKARVKTLEAGRQALPGPISSRVTPNLTALRQLDSNLSSFACSRTHRKRAQSECLLEATGENDVPM